MNHAQRLWMQASVALVAAAAHVMRLAPVVPDSAQPRETSWRDLVRRLSKNPAKR